MEEEFISSVAASHQGAILMFSYSLISHLEFLNKTLKSIIKNKMEADVPQVAMATPP